MPGDELEFVEWLQQRQPPQPQLQLGIGDDMAVVRTTTGQILISSDILLDGVHFDLAQHAPREVGRKALACSLSDCAAMAVRPVAAVVSVALPANFELDKIKEMYDGIFALAGKFEVTIAGGDTARWKHPLVIDVAITAEPYPGIGPRTRSGGKTGDLLYVTGKLGGSILGKHMHFTPRVNEARILAENFGDGLHAMMDISDGLSLDLWRMCRASGVGAILDESCLYAVISDDAKRLAAKTGRPAIDHALGDGEDFELLLAVKPDAALSHDVPVFRVGQLCERGFQFRRSDGAFCELLPSGYVH